MLTDAEVLEFYERTSDEVYRYASRLVGGDRQRAEDLLQETFLTLVRQVRTGRSEPVDIGWAITTCRSRFLDQLRRTASADRTNVRVLDRSAPTASSMSSPAEELVDGRLDATAALARLSDLQRAALVLRYIDDLPVADVAAAIGRSVRATESLLVRARASLRIEHDRTAGGSR